MCVLAYLNTGYKGLVYTRRQIRFRFPFKFKRIFIYIIIQMFHPSDNFFFKQKKNEILSGSLNQNVKYHRNHIPLNLKGNLFF